LIADYSYRIVKDIYELDISSINKTNYNQDSSID